MIRPLSLSFICLLSACAGGGPAPQRAAPPVPRTIARAPAAPPPRPSAIASAPADAPPNASAPADPEPPAPADPAPPPYDLAADLEARTRRVRAELGPQTKVEVVEGVFLVASPSGKVRSSAAVARTALAAYFNGRFSRRPEKAVVVLLFDGAAPYDGYCVSRWGSPCSTPYGFYAGAERTVVMNVAPGIGTLTHELVHPIVESDFPAAPDWINEGIASLYEAFHFPGRGEIRGDKNFRLPGLRKALRARTGPARPSLPALFGTSNDGFRGGDESLHYAAARYFCQWMESRKQLWPFYHAWRDGFADDPTGEKAFLAATGSSPEALDASWVAWVEAL
jgi:hypothetical protein